MRVSLSSATAGVLVVMSVTATVEASARRDLSVVEATAMALARNHEIAMERQTYRIAAASIDQAMGAHDFSVKVGSGFSDQTDPVNSVLSGAPPGSFGPSQSGFFASASASRLLSTGASLELSTSAARYETDNFFVILAPYYTTSLGVEFRQPLLKNQEIDAARTAIRIAQIDKTRSEASLRQVVSESVAAVEGAYWRLAAARRNVEAREASVALARRQAEEIAIRIEVGDLPKSDLSETTAVVERRKGELYGAQEVAERAENALKGLILADRGDPLWNELLVPSDSLETAAEPVDLVAALEQARTLRPELAAAQGQIDRNTVEVEAARDRLRPRLDLVAAYTLRGLAGATNPDALAIPFPGQPPADVGNLHGSLSRSYETIGDIVFPVASIGVAMDFPVGNRTAKAELVIADARRGRSELALARQTQQIEIEVRDAHAAARTAAQRIDAARAGLEASRAQLEAEEVRFETGASTNFLVLTRQDDLVLARLIETAAIADYRSARLELDRASGALLRDRGIVFANEAPMLGAAPEERP